MTFLALLAASAVAVAVSMLLLWLLSLRLRDASIVDVFWGPGFALVAAIGAVFGAAPGGRRLLIAALVALWGLRLGGYLLWRNHGRGEDPRYQAMRRHHGERFGWVSLGTVFGLREQVERNGTRSGRIVGDDHDLGRSGRHVECGPGRVG